MKDKRRDDGGAAFARPGHGVDDRVPHQDGMSLRDYFAAQALATLDFADNEQGEKHEAAQVARLAYLVADAMLAERGK